MRGAVGYCEGREGDIFELSGLGEGAGNVGEMFEVESEGVGVVGVHMVNNTLFGGVAIAEGGGRSHIGGWCWIWDD